MNIGNVLPWEDIADEAERLLAFGKGGRNAATERRKQRWRTGERPRGGAG
jgi:hypothetical protein